MASYRCDGCGATLRSADELDRRPRATGRDWFCTYCGTKVPTMTAERLQHERDGSATDRRP